MPLTLVFRRTGFDVALGAGVWTVIMALSN